MAEKKQQHSETNEENTTTEHAEQKTAATEAQTGASSSESQEQEPRRRLDQIGAIVTKGLDFVEASISLGITLANRFGSVTQERMNNMSERFGAAHSEQGDTPYGEQGMGTGPYQEGGMGEPTAPSEAVYVMNRLPLFPGSPVKVSFSINNDSVSSPKKLRLRVEGFIGEMSGAQLDSNGFSVKPATKTIAPMDFDKFTLTGTLPQDVLSDAYNGWIVVSGEEDLRIPARLIVTA